MADPLPKQRSLRLAVIGCSHGTLDDIYASVLKSDEEANNVKQPQTDVVVCCGDFQAMRNTSDLETMACPVKYRALGHFWRYYSGEKVAPKLTIVIGGNHESSGYMWELYHGGWLAPNIYFLGFAGSVLVDGWLRISGASGIWKSHDFRKGHFETVPYDDRTIRSVYHIREYDVARLLQLKNRSNAPVDVFLSHDWPLGIEQHGDTAGLIKEKPFFRDEINTNTLGSPPLHALLTALQPRYWFSAHLHVKFAALYHHDGRATTVHGRQQARTDKQEQPLIRFADPSVVATEGLPTAQNPDEIDLADDDEEENGGGREEGPLSEEKGCPDGCSADDHAHAPSTSITMQGPNSDAIALDDDDEQEEGGDDLDTQAEAEEVERMLLDPQPSALLSATETEDKGSEGEVSTRAVETAGRSTRFLALSKPGRGRDFLQVIDVPPSRSAASPPPSTGSYPAPVLFYDPHWLAILRSTSSYLSTQHRSIPFPPLEDLQGQIEQDYQWIRANVGKEGMVKVEEVQSFARTAPTQQEWEEQGRPRMPSWYTNPQTLSLAALLQIKNQINPIPEGYMEALASRQAEEEKRKKALLDEAKKAALAELDAGDATAVDEEPKGEHPGQVEKKEQIAEMMEAATPRGNQDEIQIEDDDE